MSLHARQAVERGCLVQRDRLLPSRAPKHRQPTRRSRAVSEHRVQTLERKRGLFRGGSTRRTGRPGHGQPAGRQRTLPVHYEQTIFTLGGLLQAEAALGPLRRPGSQTPPAAEGYA